MISDDITKTDTHAKALKIVEVLVLLLPLAFYIWNIFSHFWLLPCHRDTVEYLVPAIFGTSWGGYWPWLDRLTLAIGLRIFVLLMPQNTESVGQAFMLFINTAIFLSALIWLYRKYGFIAGLFIGVFFNVSYLMLLYGSIVYPDQLVSLFALLSFIVFFGNNETKRFYRPMLFAGILTAGVIFSKAIGVFILLYYAGYLLYYRRWRAILEFSLGIVIGGGLLLGLYAILYNPQSMIYTIKQFFVSNLAVNLEVLNKYYISYINIVLDMLFFPFLALLIAIGAYRKPIIRHLFLIAWANILFMYLFAAFAGAGNGPHARYIYTSFLFTIIGLSIYFAEIYYAKQPQENKLWKITVSVVLGIAVMVIIFISLNMGFTYNPALYTPTKFPTYVKWLYVLGPFLLVSLLVLNELLHSKKLILLFLFVIALWNPAYNGGWAYDYELQLVSYCQSMFRAASALEQVQADQFGVYVNSFKEIEYPERILWVYKYFVDTKYPKENGYDALYRFNQHMDQSILYIPGERKWKDAPGQVLVTDQVQAVMRLYPDAKIIQEIPYGKDTLSVLALHPK